MNCNAMPNPIRLAVAEDNAFLLRATLEKLSLKPEFQVEQIARDGQELLEGLAQDRIIDLVLMDIEMPRLNGIEATRQLKALYPQIRVLILTVFDDDDKIFNAIQAGADGYLLKEVNAEDLARGITDTLAGGAAMTPMIAAKALRLMRNARPVDDNSIPNTEPPQGVLLSPRETEVLEQIARGLTYDAVAENLFISTGTVRKHVENLYGKLKVHNKVEAAIEARRRGLL